MDAEMAVPREGRGPFRLRRRQESALTAARRGDIDAFVRLVRHEDPRMRRLAARLLDDPVHVDDVLQEAYLKAFSSIRRMSGRSAFGTWLYRIVYNACMDALRIRARERDIRSVDTPEGPEPSHHPNGDAEPIDVQRALSALPEELRVVVLLVDGDGLSYKEAAKIIGVPAGTVGSRLHRAHQLLRDLLGPVYLESEEQR